MMISPDNYVETVKNKTFGELLEERDKLIAEIKQFEKTITSPVENKWVISPDPQVVYQCNLNYLAKLCEVIQKKYNRQYVWGEVGQLSKNKGEKKYGYILRTNDKSEKTE